MLSRKYVVLFFIYSIAFFYSIGSYGQKNISVFEIPKVDVQDAATDVVLYLNVLNDKYLPVHSLRKETIQVAERIEDKNYVPLTEFSLLPDTLSKLKEVSQDTFNIFFLLDRSIHVDKGSLDRAKGLIRGLTNSYELSNHSNYFIQSFPQARITIGKALKRDELESRLKSITPSQEGSDFYFHIRYLLREIKNYPGKKLVFILSNGQDDGSKKGHEEAVQANFIINDLIPTLDQNNYLFPIGIGENPNAVILKKLAAQSLQQKDTYQKDTIPNNLHQILESKREFIQTHKIKVEPNNDIFIGETRTYQVILSSIDTTDFVVQRGSLDAPIILDTMNNDLWLIYFAFGIVILGVLLLAMGYLYPLWRQRGFKKAYVKPYEPTQRTRIIDPLTNQYIQKGELIVNKCQQTVTYDTWKGLGGQCPNYPDCMTYRDCDGAGASEREHDFFAIQGIYRHLNWLWFGAVGGFVGWIIFALYKNFGFEAYKSLIKGVYASFNIGDARIDDLTNNTILGMIFSFGLLLLLSITEERGQSRQVSWVRILMRSLIGVVLSSFVFILGFYLQLSKLVTNDYIIAFITWLAFGLIVGFVLSFRSSIALDRSLLGGLIASVLAFAIYAGGIYLISEQKVPPDLIPFVQLLRLLVMGAILGLILVSIISALEDYEWEYLSPSEYHRVVPISKWLKAGVEVNMGTAAGSYIYVKWNDSAAQPRHADLIYENGDVFIIPYAQTLVGRHIIPEKKRTKLKNGDVIRLGRDSITKMRFKVKRQIGEPNNQPSKKNLSEKASLNLGLRKSN